MSIIFYYSEPEIYRLQELDPQQSAMKKFCTHFTLHSVEVENTSSCLNPTWHPQKEHNIIYAYFLIVL